MVLFIPDGFEHWQWVYEILKPDMETKIFCGAINAMRCYYYAPQGGFKFSVWERGP